MPNKAVVKMCTGCSLLFPYECVAPGAEECTHPSIFGRGAHCFDRPRCSKCNRSFSASEIDKLVEEGRLPKIAWKVLSSGSGLTVLPPKEAAAHPPAGSLSFIEMMNDAKFQWDSDLLKGDGQGITQQTVSNTQVKQPPPVADQPSGRLFREE